MRSINESTENFEQWLASQLADRGGCDRTALRRKHARMKKDPHSFLRATFYRWAELWPADDAVQVRAVGDTHVENFGTWRDAEGRLVWGVNDFDEAGTMPWPSDLVRLGVSAHLAVKRLQGTAPSSSKVCRAIWHGYRKAVEKGKPAPMILDGQRKTWRRVVRKLIKEQTPKAFWRHEKRKLDPAQNVPPAAVAALQAALPPTAGQPTFHQRRMDAPKGLGSLGRRRFHAKAKWKGEPIVREAKAVTESALAWARKAAAGPGIASMLLSPAHSPDACQAIIDGWSVRRLAANSSKIQLKDLLREIKSVHDKLSLFHSMGAELGSLHVASETAKELQDEVARRSASWLRQAVREWHSQVRKDYEAFEPP